MAAKAHGQQQSGQSKRTLQITAAWDAYYGRFPKPLKPQRLVDDSVIVNRVRPIVDTAVASLFGQELSVKVGEKDGKTRQKALDALLKRNRKMTLLQKLGVNGAVAGHAYIKLIAEQPIPRMVALDPATVEVYTAPDDMDVVTDYAITFQSTDLASGKRTQSRQLISRLGTATGDQQKWTITDQQREGDANEWTQTGSTLWPYPFCPIVDGQNLPSPNTYYGLATVSDDLIQINKDINYILSLMARIIRFHAGPKTVGKGFNADQLKVAVDGTIVLPDPLSSLEMLEMKGDLSASLAVVEKLEAAMEVLARVPSIALAALKDMPRGTISGAALNLLYQPRRETVQVQQRLYGEMLETAFTSALAIMGVTVTEIDLNWPDFIPSDDAGLAVYAQALLNLGVSKHTVFDLIDLDYDKEQELKVAEALDSKANQEAAGLPTNNAPKPVVGAEGATPGSGEGSANTGSTAASVTASTGGASQPTSGPAAPAAPQAA